MNKTIELYRELYKDLDSNNYGLENSIYRKYLFDIGEGVVYSLSVSDKLRSLSIPIISKNREISFPVWKGVDIVLVTLPEYSGDEQLYIQLKQMPETESRIYEIVVEDIRKSLELAKSIDEFASITLKILRKWKQFFSAGKRPVLSDNSAQGLFGELLFLKELIGVFGHQIVNSWSGANNETHDYYIGHHAVEIKTTATQAPYVAHINSEYQLDDNDVNGRLFLRMYAFRKDSIGGQRLPALIKELRDSFEEDSSFLDMFNEKLIKVGYLDAAESYYTDGYTIRETYTFEVKEGFPRIIRIELINGLCDLEYSVSVAQCMDFAIETKDMMEVLKG